MDTIRRDSPSHEGKSIDDDQASSLRSFVLPGFGYAELKVRITACSPSLPDGGR